MSNARKPGQLLTCLALALGGLSGCTVVGNVSQLDDDYYRLIRRESPDSLVAALRAEKRFYVQQRADTLLFTPAAGAAPLPGGRGLSRQP